jgi:hypothetical protein
MWIQLHDGTRLNLHWVEYIRCRETTALKISERDYRTVWDVIYLMRDESHREYSHTEEFASLEEAQARMEELDALIGI